MSGTTTIELLGGRLKMMEPDLSVFGIRRPYFSVVEDLADRRDERLSHLTLDLVQLETMLLEGEVSIPAKVAYLRARDKRVYFPLGIRSFAICYNNWPSLPRKWRDSDDGGSKWVHFDGCVLNDHLGNPHTPCLCFTGGSCLPIIRPVSTPRDRHHVTALLSTSVLNDID